MLSQRLCRGKMATKLLRQSRRMLGGWLYGGKNMEMVMGAVSMDMRL